MTRTVKRRGKPGRCSMMAQACKDEIYALSRHRIEWFVGSWLVKALLKDGHEVDAMCRKTSDRSSLEAHACNIAYGDITDSGSLLALVENVQVIYHCAGTLGAVSQETFDVVNAAGVRNLVDAIREANPKLKRLVLVSSIAAGGPSDIDRPRTEAEPADQNTKANKKSGSFRTRPSKLRLCAPRLFTVQATGA